MKILITGASGFIGKHLAARLVSGGNHVVCVDRQPLPLRENNMTNICCDVSQEGWTDKLPDDIDNVCHLAQSSEYRNFPEGANDMFRVNIESTFHLAEWSRTRNVKGFIFASTGSVYKKKQGLHREDDACESSSMYSCSKLCAEDLIYQYRDFFKSIILRPFTVYGPSQKNMLIPKLCKSVHEHSDIYVDGHTGLNLTPLYIDDLCEIISRLLTRILSIPSGYYNACGTECVTLLDIATKLASLLNKEPKIRYTDKKPEYIQGDGTRLWSLIGYKPSTTMDEGLKKVVQEMRGA